MRTTMVRMLTAAFLATMVATTSATDRAVYTDGNIEVVLVTKPLPKEFAGNDADPGWPWFGVRTVVTRISVTAGAVHSVLSTKAYLGLTDPRAVEIERLPPKGSWTLTVGGGDTSTAYRTVMAFKNENVRLVKECALEADARHPDATMTFSPPRSLN